RLLLLPLECSRSGFLKTSSSSCGSLLALFCYDFSTYLWYDFTGWLPTFLPEVKTILSNGQYLEIYVKHCLRDTGVELIGYPIDQKGKKAFTNIRYQIDGDAIEVDVHGIASPLTLLLCEAKTSVKIQANELRRVEGLYDRLVEKINT